MKLEQRSKAAILKDAEAMDARYKAMIQRQIDSINRLLGNVVDDKKGKPSQVRMYEDELMALNDVVAKTDVQNAEYLGIIRRVRQHAVDTGNDRLLEIVGEVGMHGDQVNTGSIGQQSTEDTDSPNGGS